MGARGRRGLLAGLSSLSASVSQIDERNRRRLADSLALAENARRDEELSLHKRSLAQQAAAAQIAANEDRKAKFADLQAALAQEIPRARVAKAIGEGNELKAKRIAIRRGLLDPSAALLQVDHPSEQGLSDYERWKADPTGFRKFKEASHFSEGASPKSLLGKALEAAAARKDYTKMLLPERLGSSIGSEIDPSSRLGQLSSLDEIAAGAKPAQEKALTGEFDRFARLRSEAQPDETDPLESLSQDEWEAVARQVLVDVSGGDEGWARTQAATPVAQRLRYSAPHERRKALLDFPRLFGPKP